MPEKSVLVVDDDPSMLELASYQLRLEGFEVQTAESGQEALTKAQTFSFAIALTDLLLPDMDGIELVTALKEMRPETEVIMITGYGSVSKAVDAIRAGAFYYVEKPVDFDQLLALIDKALERRNQAREIKQLRGRLASKSSYDKIIGSSKPMQDLYEVIESVAQSDANILIIGESGTGKELVANAIHYQSHRSKCPIMKVNCAALPKELIESELFGHTKGAFTGATADRIGLVGRATGGSLMLDEIAEMPLELQPKLLRLLQERIYHRLGSEKPIEADFRLICATNRDPMDAIDKGMLREDLYYRINTIEINVPPLRERVEDIQHLAEHFLREFAAKYDRPVSAFSQEAYARMFAYQWPGNVRELENTVERAVLLCKGDTIPATSMPVQQAVVASSNRPAGQVMSLEEIGRLIIDILPDLQSNEPSADVFTLLEGILLNAALDRTRGNKQAAATLLGIYRPRLYSMIKRHGLQSESESEEERELPVSLPAVSHSS